MLCELYIENLAVIKKASIPFCGGLNVFTGETGAGKSILIGGINAVLGQRMTRDIVRTGEDKAIITALFRDIPQSVKDKLSEYGFECEEELYLSREINSDGGSVARINSRPAAVSILREIGNLLINIHGQHDNQILLSPEKHLEILDSYGDLEPLREQYREKFHELQQTARKIKLLSAEEAARAQREEQLRQIIEDIGALEITENEDERVEEEYRLVKNSDTVARAALMAVNAVSSEDEVNISEQLNNIFTALMGCVEYMPTLEPFAKRIESARIELEDISMELSAVADKLDYSPERFEEIKSRREELYRIKKKYGPELSDVLDKYNSAKRELQDCSQAAEDIERLALLKKELLSAATDLARRLSSEREKAAERFVGEVTEQLRFLNMPNVQLVVRQEKGKLTVSGMDTVEFLISANPGEEPKPIAKIASGGELSRIMLSLKSVIADKDDIPTMIFDEIDTGVSGHAARKIGIKLSGIGSVRQVLCVTHLAQIASFADEHLMIEKKVSDGRTATEVSLLDMEGRKREIARIMGGETELMLKNAEELIISAAEEKRRK